MSTQGVDATKSYVNITAFAATAGLGAATAACVIGAVTTASTATIIALTILSITGAALSIASITAWIDISSTSVEEYFNNLKHHSGYAIAGMYQIVAQTLVQALIQGIAHGVETKIRRWIAGADTTVKVTQ